MDNEWVEHKSIIKHYWIVENMKLNQVADIMRKNHGFDKKYDLRYPRWVSIDVFTDPKPTKPSSANGVLNSARIERLRYGKS